MRGITPYKAIYVNDCRPEPGLSRYQAMPPQRIPTRRELSVVNIESCNDIASAQCRAASIEAAGSHKLIG